MRFAARYRVFTSLLLITGPPVTLLWIAVEAMAPPPTGSLPLATTPADFFQRGTQPEPDPGFFEPILSAVQCTLCHANYDPQAEPFEAWAASMKGQSARDPLFHACLSIANQDADNAGGFCVRCHAPNAYLSAASAESVPNDGSAFGPLDFEGINCNFCHRVVDPEYKPGVSPPQDEAILADLELEDLIPPEPSNSRYVVDPVDTRRGPFDDVPANMHVPVEILVSPFHTASEFCWNCHDVSNPLLVRQPDDSYVLDVRLGTPHPTGSQFDMFPLHRTYSEWKNSYYFTVGGVQHNGRFGGNHINNPDFIADGTAGIMHVCQDCHMPDQFGKGCLLPDPFFDRPDMPQHSFIGSNTWVLDAVRDLYPDAETGLSAQSVLDMQARNVDMLENASDLELTQVDDALRVRIFNQSGHKLPTGFPDGRRMWINVKFLGARDQLLAEDGAYDFANAALDVATKKVYEIRLGIDANQAAITGLPQGPTFHFVVANTIAKDNRIPPTGFSNIIAQQQQMEPVGASYSDGQHWDDTDYAIPAGTTRAVVTVYYQLVSRDYIEFLRDTNQDQSPTSTGMVAYGQWLQHGMSDPVVMEMAEIALVGPILGDISGPMGIPDGFVDPFDLAALLGGWCSAVNDPNPPSPPCENCLAKNLALADITGPRSMPDGCIDAFDLAVVLANWTGRP